MAKQPDDQHIVYFSPLKLRPFLELSREAGVDLASVLAAHGTTEVEMLHPETRLPRTTCIQIIRALLVHLNDPLAGLRAGERARLTDVDVLGYLAQHCATALDAMETAQRYSRLVGDASRVTLTREAGRVTIRVGLSGGRASIPELADFAVASGHVVLSDLTGGEVRALSVELARPKPRDPRPYRAFFGAPVTFGARAGQLVYAEAAMLRPLPQRDARLAALLAEHAETRLKCLPDVSTLVEQVRSQLRSDVTVGPPSLAKVASKFRMSERTLRRRLHATGESFRTLLDDVRQERAFHLLNAGEHSVADIAQQLGFSDATTFGRAFRRWTGATPSERRART